MVVLRNGLTAECKLNHREGMSPLGELQALSTDAKPVDNWESKDEPFAEIAIAIRKCVEG